MVLGDSRNGCGAVERVEGEALSLGGVQTLGRAGSRGVEGLGTVGECMMDEHVCFLLRPGVRRRHQCREETGELERLDRPRRSRRLLPRVEPGLILPDSPLSHLAHAKPTPVYIRTCLRPSRRREYS